MQEAQVPGGPSAPLPHGTRASFHRIIFLSKVLTLSFLFSLKQTSGSILTPPPRKKKKSA